jgi:hypothetical protein
LKDAQCFSNLTRVLLMSPLFKNSNMLHNRTLEWWAVVAIDS